MSSSLDSCSRLVSLRPQLKFRSTCTTTRCSMKSTRRNSQIISHGFLLDLRRPQGLQLFLRVIAAASTRGKLMPPLQTLHTTFLARLRLQKISPPIPLLPLMLQQNNSTAWSLTSPIGAGKATLSATESCWLASLRR